MSTSNQRGDVQAWDLHVTREYPYATLDHRSLGPARARVEVSVTFWTEAAAEVFEAAVRDLLQDPRVN